MIDLHLNIIIYTSIFNGFIFSMNAASFNSACWHEIFSVPLDFFHYSSGISVKVENFWHPSFFGVHFYKILMFFKKIFLYFLYFL